MEKTEAMAKGRRLAYLKRCLLAQELLQEHETKTSVRKMVFANHIKPVLGCSYPAFNKMLNVVNPKKEIELLTFKN